MYNISGSVEIIPKTYIYGNSQILMQHDGNFVSAKAETVSIAATLPSFSQAVLRWAALARRNTFYNAGYTIAAEGKRKLYLKGRK